jgi:hypothetical protein
MLSPPTLDVTLSALSAMITPAVMILATGSLILTTTNRLVRALDRIRETLPDFERLAALDMHDEPTEKRWAMMNEQIQRATTRARLMQRALTRLYVALGAFLTTSVSLGIIAFARLNAAWIPLTLGLIGVGLLLSASVLMIIESRIALNSTYAEMDYIRSISRRTVKP